MKLFGIRIGPKYHVVKPLDQKTSLTWKITRLLYSGQDAVWMPKDYTTFAKQGYQACVDVFACIDLIARSISSIPLVLYSKAKSKGEKREEIESHPLLDLLQRPNPQQGGSAFLDAAVRYYLIAGNSYIEAVMAGQVPKELYVLRPDRMTVLVGDLKNRIAGYRYTVGGNRQDFIKGEALHLKAFHPTDDFYGLSPIEIAARHVDISNAGSTWNAKLLQNDLRPSGLFLFEKEMGAEQREIFKASVKDTYLDVNNKGLPLVLDGKADYKQLSISSKDADFTELDKAVTRKICRAFNIPPELIGDSQNKTYSNYQEARLAFYMETVLPIAFWLRDELNNWLVRKFETQPREGELASSASIELDWDLDKVEALQAKKAEAYNRMAGAWWTTINEKRQACGYDEQDGGDVCMIPMGLTSLDISVEPEDEPEPPAPIESPPPTEESPTDEPIIDEPPTDDEPPPPQKSMQTKSYWSAPEHNKALWLTFETRVKAREKSFEQIAKSYLIDQASEIRGKLEKVSDLSAVNPKHLIDKDVAVSKYTKAFKAWYEDHFVRAGNAGIQATKGQLFDDGEFKAGEPTSWTFTMTAEQRAKLKQMIFESGTEITKTTIQKIYNSLLTAQAENMTLGQFTQSLHDQVEDMSIWRARLWARTESVKVDNYGNLEGYRETEFVDMKIWNSAFAENSRADHVMASGQEALLDDDFDIGGEAMAFPGDPRGSAGNVCNCMCFLSPKVGE